MNPFKLIWTKPYLAIHRAISSVDYNEEFVRPIKAFFSVRKAFLEDSLEERKKARADKYFTRKLTKWFNSQKVFFAQMQNLKSMILAKMFHQDFTLNLQ